MIGKETSFRFRACHGGKIWFKRWTRLLLQPADYSTTTTGNSKGIPEFLDQEDDAISHADDNKEENPLGWENIHYHTQEPIQEVEIKLGDDFPLQELQNHVEADDSFGNDSSTHFQDSNLRALKVVLALDLGCSQQ